MGKIKINMLSGTTIEKPLVTAFKGEHGDYIVLDNEMSGTMGLPIILISKLEGANLSKIADKSPEWDATKEMLRQIIAGNPVEYITAPLEVNASDGFFTQLTLPINSFDLLRNRYTFSGSNDIGNGAINDSVQSATLTSTPVQPVAPAVEPTPAPVQPVAPAVEPTPAPVQPVAPAVEPAPTPVQQVAPAVEPAPTPVQPAAPVDFTADKEAFLKACENMFDALVAKVNNK